MKLWDTFEKKVAIAYWFFALICFITSAIAFQADSLFERKDLSVISMIGATLGIVALITGVDYFRESILEARLAKIEEKLKL